MSGTFFTLFGALAIPGLKEWKMPTPGWYADWMPLCAFSAFSAVQFKVLKAGKDASDFAFYDIGPGPFWQRVFQMTDNLASFLEPVFYLQYSHLADPFADTDDFIKMGEDKCDKQDDKKSKSMFGMTYCSANIGAQSVNLISGVSTLVVNGIALFKHINQSKPWELNHLLYNDGNWTKSAETATKFLDLQTLNAEFKTQIATSDRPDPRCLDSEKKETTPLCNEANFEIGWPWGREWSIDMSKRVSKEWLWPAGNP